MPLSPSGWLFFFYFETPLATTTTANVDLLNACLAAEAAPSEVGHKETVTDSLGNVWHTELTPSGIRYSLPSKEVELVLPAAATDKQLRFFAGEAQFSSADAPVESSWKQVKFDRQVPYKYSDDTAPEYEYTSHYGYAYDSNQWSDYTIWK